MNLFRKISFSPHHGLYSPDAIGIGGNTFVKGKVNARQEFALGMGIL